MICLVNSRLVLCIVWNAPWFCVGEILSLPFPPRYLLDSLDEFLDCCVNCFLSVHATSIMIHFCMGGWFPGELLWVTVCTLPCGPFSASWLIFDWIVLMGIFMVAIFLVMVVLFLVRLVLFAGRLATWILFILFFLYQGLNFCSCFSVVSVICFIDRCVCKSTYLSCCE